MPVIGSSHLYGPWIGGFNASKPSDDLDPREIYDGENMRVLPDGSLRQRYGTTPYNSSALSGNPTVDTLGQHAFDADTKKVWAIAGGKFWEDTGNDGGFDNRTSSFTITAGKRWSMADAFGTLIGHNGVNGDTIIKWTAAGGNIAALDVDSRFAWAKYWDFWNNRAWAANASTGTEDVWRSDVGAIETWGSTSFFQLGTICTGIRSMSNFMTCHSESSITLLVPTGNAVVPYRQVPKQAKGTISNASLLTVTIPGVGEVQLYIREDGIYAFDGESSRKLSEPLDGSRYWDSINTSALKDSFAVNDPVNSEIIFYLPYGAGQTTMNHRMVYNYRLGNFYVPWTGTTRAYAAYINNKPHSGGISDGFVYNEAGTNLTDTDGTTETAIDGWFETSSQSPAGEDVTPRWLFNRTTLDIKGTFPIEFSAIMQSSPGIYQTIEPQGTYAAIETAFQIGISAIADDTSHVLNLDQNLNGYDPHIRLKYRNAGIDEEMSIRKATCVYRLIGRTRKRREGVI